MSEDRFCGNCPARLELVKGSSCRIYGNLPWTRVPDPYEKYHPGQPHLMDMVRPNSCKRKPRNQTEALHRAKQAFEGLSR